MSSINSASEFESTVKRSLEAQSGADLGNPLLEQSFDQGKFEQASEYINGDLAYYESMVKRLMGRPEAKELFDWMQSEAQDDSNVLLRLLSNQANSDR